MSAPTYVAVREVHCRTCNYRKLLTGADPLICPRNQKHGEMEDAAIAGIGKALLVDVCPTCGFAMSHDGADDDPNTCPACSDIPVGVEMRIVAVAK